MGVSTSVVAAYPAGTAGSMAQSRAGLTAQASAGVRQPSTSDAIRRITDVKASRPMPTTAVAKIASAVNGAMTSPSRPLQHHASKRDQKILGGHHGRDALQDHRHAGDRKDESDSMNTGRNASSMDACRRSAASATVETRSPVPRPPTRKTPTTMKSVNQSPRIGRPNNAMEAKMIKR